MSRQPMGRAGLDPKKVSGELFSLTYGAFVAQILKDYENVDDVNKQGCSHNFVNQAQFIEFVLKLYFGQTSVSQPKELA